MRDTYGFFQICSFSCFAAYASTIFAGMVLLKKEQLKDAIQFFLTYFCKL